MTASLTAQQTQLNAIQSRVDRLAQTTTAQHATFGLEHTPLIPSTNDHKTIIARYNEGSATWHTPGTILTPPPWKEEHDTEQTNIQSQPSAPRTRLDLVSDLADAHQTQITAILGRLDRMANGLEVSKASLRAASEERHTLATHFARRGRATKY